MANGIIPKEQLTAYQRWELADFSQPKPVPKVAEPAPDPVAQAAATQFQLELESLREQARQLGYQEGFEQGQQQGLEQGEQQGFAAGKEQGLQHAHIHISALQQVMGNLQNALDQVDAEVANSLLELALEVANKMVCTTLEINRDILFNVVNDAINTLPHFNQHAHLILHPEDAKLIREHMMEQLNNAGWKIFTDSHIERGGCRLETNHSQVDASNEARWKRIVESIGVDHSWKR